MHTPGADTAKQGRGSRDCCDAPVSGTSPRTTWRLRATAWMTRTRRSPGFHAAASRTIRGSSSSKSIQPYRTRFRRSYAVGVGGERLRTEHSTRLHDSARKYQLRCHEQKASRVSCASSAPSGRRGSGSACAGEWPKSDLPASTDVNGLVSFTSILGGMAIRARERASRKALTDVVTCAMAAGIP